MKKIPIAIVGVGNCAKALVEGVHFYSQAESPMLGLMHPLIGGYRVTDIAVVAAFDIDSRKVGRKLGEAIYADPNNAAALSKVPLNSEPTVHMGRVLDGVAAHVKEFPLKNRADVSPQAESSSIDIENILGHSGAKILVNFLPVGSEQATKVYVEAALEVGLGVVNCIPVFVASDPEMANKFTDANLPIIGDDIKSQAGATILHRTLTTMLSKRGVRLNHMYQLNVGGNTDFMNMLSRERLLSKRISKTEAVQSVMSEPMDAASLHVGPSDYVEWLGDTKVCFLRIEGQLFGGAPIEMDIKLRVPDSPNSAGCVVDAIRCAQLALDRGFGGPINAISAYFMKRPPIQISDEAALNELTAFIAEPQASR